MSDKFSLSAIIALAILATATSCGHKEIVCPAPEEINIVFEWDNAPHADIAGMALLFYPLDGNERIWRFDIAGKEGGQIKLPSGTYELISCNNDLPGIILGNTESPSTLSASARCMETDKETGVYASSGMLYCGEISRLEVTPCGIRYTTANGTIKECSRRIMRCKPDSVATVYTVEFTHVDGIERIRSAVVELEGVRSSILLETDRSSDIPATLAIEMDTDSGNGTICGSGCAFAPNHILAAKYLVKLQILLTNGKTVAREIDIKPENLNIITPHNVLITIDGIVIPEGDPSGDIGGIGAIVDGWEVIKIDLGPTIQ